MKLVSIAIGAALALTAYGAQAEPGKNGKDHGHASAGAPPGLAKKPYGMPPGQAKKIYGRGQTLPRTYFTERYYVVNPVAYQLAPAPYGYRWVRVDDRYYLAQTRTGLITQAVAALLR
jgi:Ni/Co efflux regulator RcnB